MIASEMFFFSFQSEDRTEYLLFMARQSLGNTRTLEGKLQQLNSLPAGYSKYFLSKIRLGLQLDRSFRFSHRYTQKFRSATALANQMYSSDRTVKLNASVVFLLNEIKWASWLNMVITSFFTWKRKSTKGYVKGKMSAFILQKCFCLFPWEE